MCAPKTSNEITVEILNDGSVKITTGTFEGAKHAAAEAMLREIASALGDTKRTRKPGAPVHHHHHDSEHEHNHQGSK